jgi:hypothetical protein
MTEDIDRNEGPENETNKRFYVFVGVFIVAVLFVAWRNRVPTDFWPLDRSPVGPNLVAAVVQWAIIAVVAVVLYPPWRRAAHKFIDRKLAPIHEHFRLSHAKADRNAELLGHIIRHHPDIPEGDILTKYGIEVKTVEPEKKRRVSRRRNEEI